jgi:acid phosphatase type 7
MKDKRPLRGTKDQGPRGKGQRPILPATNPHLRPVPSPRSLLPVLVLLAVLLGACASGEAQGLSAPTELPTLPPTEVAPATETPVVAVLIAVGDIATCNGKGDDVVALLVENLPGDIALLGDNAYEKGSESQYRKCYDPGWGLFKNRTHPAPGNHDYLTDEAAGYFNYFGAAAGNPAQGYYSYDLGAWHLIALNSNCSQVGGCQAGSPQEQWLRADLAAHPAGCTLAYWHHPLFSSGQHGSNAQMWPVWQALYEAEADVVLNGHDHDYERFAPQDPQGAADAARGLREFVVGTGGKNHYEFSRAPEANSEVRNDHTFGVLKLTLSPQSYTWEFIPEPGETFTDQGEGECH